MQENKIKGFAKFLGISEEKEVPKKKKQESATRQWVITEKPAEDGGNTYKMVGYPVLIKAKNKDEFMEIFCKRATPLVEKMLNRKISSLETEGIVRKLVRIETYTVKRPS